MTSERLDVLIKKAISEYSPHIKNRVAYSKESEITFEIVAGEKGIAATGGWHIKFFSDHFIDKSDLEVLGVCAHEMTHAFQQIPYEEYQKYPWLVEGIADLQRHECTGEKWREKADPRLSYKHTANFLIWAESKYQKELAQPISIALRDKKYNNQIFEKITGTTFEGMIDIYLSRENQVRPKIGIKKSQNPFKQIAVNLTNFIRKIFRFR